MFSLSDFIISPAFAQEAVPAPQSGTEVFMNYVPFILIFLVFYMLVIRPQQKKLVDQEKMVKALQRGDRVVTSGGIHGKVAKVEDNDVLSLEIADGVQIKVDKSSVVSLEAKPQPVSADAKDKKDQ